jgi:WD40 repeat protein
VFTPDGKRLLATRGSDAFVTDVATGKELARFEGHAANVLSVAVSADGTRMATADHAGLIRLWDATTFRPVSEPAGHRAMIEHAELSPDGKRLVTWAADETVRVWDMTTGKELRAFAGAVKLGGPPCPRRQQPTFTPDGLAVVFSTADRLITRDVLTGLEVPLPGEIAKLNAGFAVFAPDAKAVLTWDSVTAHLAVWDWPSGKKRFTFENIHDPVRPGFSPDGSSFFLEDTRPTHYDAATGKELPPGWLAEPRYWAAPVESLRPNPRYLIAESFGSPQLITAGNGKSVPNCRIRAPEDGWSWYGCGVTVSPNRRQLAIGGLFEPYEVRVYEARSGQFRRTFHGHRGKARVLGFTPDGARLLTAGADHTVLMWDARPQSMPLSDAMRRETDAAKLWIAMCAGKGQASYLAMARLAAEPDAAVKTARLRLKPAAAPPAAALDRVLRDLGNTEFAVREAAERELDGYGEPAAELVNARLAKIDSPEARRRAEGFVKRWTGEVSPVRLADMRAIELLESLGTVESRAFLKELASGDASAWRTREAKRALEQVGK